MTQDVYDIGVDRYKHAIGFDELERDDDGFIVLKPSASRVDQKMADLITNISSLEEKLKKYKAEQAQTKKYQQSDEYKESKKKQSKKKKKKEKENLLEMIFNNADNIEDAEDDEDGTYDDSKKTKAAKRKATQNKETTLETTYGKRFSPVVSLLFDTINDFDKIAADIEDDLRTSKSKSMYRSNQIGNLISAKDKKLSAVNKLADVAKTLSDLEYKKEKDKKGDEGDSNKLIANFASKYLSGAFDDEEDRKSGKKKNKKKSKGLSVADLDDDDDDDESSIKRSKESDAEDREIAAKLANRLMENKDKVTMTAHEKYVAMEGKYLIAVVADPVDPDNDWKYIALDPKSRKEIKDFKDKYKGLLPKKSAARMTFDLSRLRAYDKNTAKTYQLLLKE